MMAPDPLRSATTVEGAEDTSLALPSDRNLSSGRQRVLDQVHSIKRTKSKHGNSVSASPTSPSTKPFTTYNEFGTFKFMPSKGNDLLSRTNSTMTSSYNKVTNFQKIRSQSARVPKGRHISSSTTWEQQMNATIKKPNGLKTSRSDPTLAPPLSPAQSRTLSMRGQNTIRVHQQSTSSMVNGTNITNSQTRIVQPPQPQIDGRMGTIKMSKMEQTSMVNSAMSVSDITIKEAVEYLSHPEVDYQRFGASAIQHYTFNDDEIKKEVQYLEGIPALVNLLDSSHPPVSQFAAGALRNLVFRNEVNKLQVHEYGGIAKALNLLKKTESTETKKQITGLLWNLSSEDKLKQDLMDTALPALTESVVVPFTSNNTDFVDSTVFYHTTGCLRNLSSGSVMERNIMRNCPNLISSLMTFVESCIEKETTDDKSVENCVCILQNVTFQLGKERPEAFSEHSQTRESTAEEKKNATVGCFSPRSSKVQNKCFLETHLEKSIDSSQSRVKPGVKLLCQPNAIDNYLSLLEFSKEEPTREASCGALQNLTSGKGSGAVCQILLQKFKSLPIFESLIRSDNATIRKTALSLLDNMSRSRVQVDMAKQMLPDLVVCLDLNTEDLCFSDEDAVILSNTVLRLMLADSEVTKKIIDKNMVSQLIKVASYKGDLFPNGSKVASVLLYNMWNDKNLYSIVKKMGFSKRLFVNKKSTEAFNTTFTVKHD